MLTAHASPAPAAPSAAGREPYQPRRPETTVLYQVVARHLPGFLARIDADSGRSGLPGFVRRELLALLDCGILARGFLRVRCPRCREELLVAFSCKGRGICPSCGGRRTILAAITQTDVIRATLAALGLPTESPMVHPARGPPGLFDVE